VPDGGAGNDVLKGDGGGVVRGRGEREEEFLSAGGRVLLASQVQQAREAEIGLNPPPPGQLELTGEQRDTLEPRPGSHGSRDADPMSILYIGPDDFFRPELAQACRAAGHHISALSLEEAEQAPGQWSADIVIMFQPSASDVRRLIQRRSGSIGHFLLISSYKVYPSAFRLSPWRVDDIDVVADGGVEGNETGGAHARRAEHELQLRKRDLKAWTVLRPAIIEGVNDPLAHSAWFVNRILDGGPIILPDQKTTVYRHVSAEDLARAALAVAGNENAFGSTLNVASRGMLTYWGHAAMLRDGLQRRVEFKYVPLARWRAAGLPLPIAEDLNASFIETSPLLSELGWEPSDELGFVTGLARAFAEFPRIADKASRELERRVLAEAEAGPDMKMAHGVGLPRIAQARQWAIRAWPGEPTSLTLQRFDAVQKLPAPVLQTRRLVLGAPEAQLLRGELPVSREPRVVGHNALVEVINAGTSGLANGSLAIPFSRLPCDDKECEFCGEATERTLGIDCDGYGWKICTTPSQHLVPVAAEMKEIGLLASPLAALMEVFADVLSEGAGPLWVCGQSVEAALLTWLAEDAGRHVVHLDRVARPHPEFSVRAIKESVDEVNEGRTSAPNIIVDFTSNFEVALAMLPVLPRAGGWWGWQRPSRLPSSLTFRRLPIVAKKRATLERALDLLQSWLKWRDVSRRIGPAVPLDAYWDVFTLTPFAQPYIEIDES